MYNNKYKKPRWIKNVKLALNEWDINWCIYIELTHPFQHNLSISFDGLLYKCMFYCQIILNITMLMTSVISSYLMFNYFFGVKTLQGSINLLWLFIGKSKFHSTFKTSVSNLYTIMAKSHMFTLPCIFCNRWWQACSTMK